MKLLLIAIVLFSSKIFAQNFDAKVKEKIEFRVYYQHEHLRDVSRPDKIYKENMVLLAGENYSQFLSYDKILEHISVESLVISEFNLGNTRVKIPAGKIIIPEEIILSFSSDQALIATYMAAHFHYFKSLPAINWELKNESKIIEGLTCYNASTNYLGRNWEVWYAPEVAIRAGPWFLRGLPGLIIEAEDSSKEVKYLFTRLESMNMANEVFKKRRAYQQIGLLEFDSFESNLITETEKNTLLNLARKDINSFKRLQALNGGSGMFVEYGITNYYSWLKEIPNPIDLTEK
jgi:GLPGLI family protein